MDIKTSNNNRIFNFNNMKGVGIPFLSIDMFDQLGVPNLYTTRYKTWNDETGVGETGVRLCCMKTDNWDEVVPEIRANMDSLVKQLGTSLETECVTHQKHTANVYTVKEDDLGFGPVPEHRRNIDGLITAVPNAVLVAYGGDCPPVYIADPVTGTIGLVHAGWRGTFAKIPQVAIDRMIEEFGCRPENMYAAVGPGICQSCYEMGDEVYDQLKAEWGQADADALMKRVVNPDGSLGKYHLDLWAANRLTLERCGIPADHIAVTNVCTCCNADWFYSYRARRMENEQEAMLVNRFDKI